jgi:hypothetical protein
MKRYWKELLVSLSLGGIAQYFFTCAWAKQQPGEVPVMLYGFPLPWAEGVAALTERFDIAPVSLLFDSVLYAIPLLPLVGLGARWLPGTVWRVIATLVPITTAGFFAFFFFV